MFLQNMAVRLITINTVGTNKTVVNPDTGKDKVIGVTKGQEFMLMPAGDPVEVPSPHCDTDYVTALIDCGDVRVVSEDEPSVKLNKAELIAKAELLGIEVDPKATKAMIIEAIAENEE